MMPVTFPEAAGPEGLRLYAIGDVHGRADLLASLHGMIRADLTENPAHDWRIVHLGDYVDRGPNSKNVLDFLIDAQEKDGRNLVLAGNHDVSFLDFLALAEPDGVFARNGGRETALSYGAEIDFDNPVSVDRGYVALVDAVPQAHVEFIKHLPRAATFGDFFFCHAGIRPGVPLDRQDPEDLIWIRREFLDWTEPFEKVVIHGHTPLKEIDVRINRVNVDTFAWHSGRLSAIVIDGAAKRFIQTQP
ncbi:serine/threonine protein phosphatase [Phyllobacterium salinisoli]|uniref:Serine/threonine protein phosphatase n=1 Tax=Phyllobacterium salinisoli TaxID=1899321 RepID=A0A368K831_9HYPH|nr:metallophosphoesterase [Phyllobacterium salinisoli]RCS24633.1 serine/threonine protein phosphatase [Phyllobacterium salinisoli]